MPWQRFSYLLLNIAIVAGPLLAIATSAKLRALCRRELSWQRITLLYLLVFLVFIPWDIWAAHSGHWAFSAHYTIGLRLGGLPLEEFAFFVTVPFACLFVWLWLHDSVNPRRVPDWIRPLVLATWFAAFMLSALRPHGPYTRIVLVLFVVLLFVIWKLGLWAQKVWWLYALACISLFLVTNTILTAPPIVSYGSFAITGFRIGTIPIEDSLYNAVLISLVAVAMTLLPSRATASTDQ